MTRDIPIIFSGPMVRALLDGRKTMTRRLARKYPKNMSFHNDALYHPTPWQNVKPGDRLWVRETWCIGGEVVDRVCYRASEGSDADCWRSPIHMARTQSRLTLIVTATKIERLQEISEADAIAEGCEASPEEITFWWDGYDTRIRDRDGNAGSVSQCAVGKYEHATPEWMELARRSKHMRPAVPARHRFETLWRILHGTDSWDANPEVVALTFTVHKTNIDALPKSEAA